MDRNQGHLFSDRRETQPQPVVLDWRLRTLWILRILVACRVSALSVTAGVLLFLLSSQARDLFADTALGALPASLRAWGFWLVFFAYLVFIWAFPAHYAARRMLYSDAWMFSCRVRGDVAPQAIEELRKDLRWWIDWIPRFLAAIPFLAVLVGLWVAYGVVAQTQGLAPSRTAAPQIYTLAVLDVAVGLIFLAFLWWRRILTKKMSMRVAQTLAIAYGIIVSALFFASVVWPFFPADIAPRAAIVPLLFGSFVFMATFLAWASHKICVPVLALSIVAALAVTALNPHFNDLRTLASASDDFGTRQLDVDEAIKRWMDVNCDKVKATCPPALVVALEGGASRAAFAGVTAIGELLDQAGKLPDGDNKLIAPARRIFAISGVSGGSVGAATIRTALSDSLQRGQGAPPCLKPTSDWFREEKASVRSSWRACLQALVSGDYLTPAFVGLAFRDNLSPPNPVSGGSLLFSDDRAALMERAIERHYDYVIRGDVPNLAEEISNDLLGPGATAPDSGLRRRFGFVWDIRAADGGWLPLLLLNGTSVGTGARVIASDIISTRSVRSAPGHEAGRFSLYPSAFDVFEMLSKPCEKGKVVDGSCVTAHAGAADIPKSRNGPDIRLSTAAMLSARFPIISPAAILRAEGANAIEDRVVDGGYFENAGLTTAMDVARALRRAGIVPVVLWVQNGPRTDAGDPQLDAKPALAANPPAPDPAELPSHVPPRGAATPLFPSANPGVLERVFGVVVTPIFALAATRDGHGDEAAADAQRELYDLNNDVAPKSGDSQASQKIGSSYFKFGMFENPDFEASNKDAPLQAGCASLGRDWRRGVDKMSDVSMSWWLSQSVQAELDAQICDRRNRETFADLAQRLSQHCPIKPRDLSNEEAPPARTESTERCE
jgi:hypothetical protein